MYLYITKSTQFSILIILEVQKIDFQGNWKEGIINFPYLLINFFPFT